MSTSDELCDVVVVTNRLLCPRPLSEQVERLCALHPAAVVLREKDLGPGEYGDLAGTVAGICAGHGVEFVAHGHLGVAGQLGVASVHLPLPALAQADPAELSSFAQVGCSVHSADEAREAVALGATRLVAGHVYETACKPGLAPRGTAFLRGVCAAVDVPVWGIGGIGLAGARVQEVLGCGAEKACVMSAAMRL